MPINIPVRNGNIIKSLYNSTREGEHGLSHVPALLRQIIEEAMWKSFIVEATGELVEHEKFITFVTEKPLRGLGTTVDFLMKLCGEDAELLQWLRELTTNKKGNFTGINQYHKSENSDNITISTSDNRGTSKAYELQRLQNLIDKAEEENNTDYHQELLDYQQKVYAGALSINKVLTELGIKERKISISFNVKSAANTIKKHFSEEQVQELIKLLAE